MRVVLSTVLRECSLAAGDPRPERATRRNITLSPRHGTRVVLERRVAEVGAAPAFAAARLGD